MQKWEYALVKFEKGASKVVVITHGMNFQELEFNPMNLMREKYKSLSEMYHRPNELVIIDFLSNLGQSGWEVVEVLANDQMFLKRPLGE